MRYGLAIGVVLGAVGAAASLDVHEFWIVPDAFSLRAGSTVVASGRSGHRFVRARSPIRPTMLADARLIGPDGETRISDVSSDGQSLRLRHKPRRPGQYIVAVALKPRTARVTQTAFVRYLRAERADSEAARLGREPAFGPADTVTYRSARYATAIVDVGSGPRVFAGGTGYPIDIIPMSDPARATAGDTLSFRAVLDSHRLPRLLVRIVRHERESTSPPQDDRRRMAGLELVTDAEGIVRVPLVQPGVWGLSTARVVLLASPGPRGPEPGFWDVTWATYVFRVAPRRTP